MLCCLSKQTFSSEDKSDPPWNTNSYINADKRGTIIFRNECTNDIQNHNFQEFDSPSRYRAQLQGQQEGTCHPNILRLSHENAIQPNFSKKGPHFAVPIFLCCPIAPLLRHLNYWYGKVGYFFIILGYIAFLFDNVTNFAAPGAPPMI